MSPMRTGTTSTSAVAGTHSPLPAWRSLASASRRGPGPPIARNLGRSPRRGDWVISSWAWAASRWVW
eukprot:scaffold5047_cov42-Phaeocystis_antarctica.AAC.4